MIFPKVELKPFFFFFFLFFRVGEEGLPGVPGGLDAAACARSEARRDAEGNRISTSCIGWSADIRSVVVDMARDRSCDQIR